MTTPLPVGFDLRVLLLSDWLIGTGQGRIGVVDATVRRDADGLPFVPAKTVTGILRDACERVAGWLDNGSGEWQRWVDWLFGSQPDRPGDRTQAAGRAPMPAVLSLSAAREPASVAAAVRDKPALRQAAVTVRPGVEIDPRTDTAQEKMLRLEERARPGLLVARARFGCVEDRVPVAAELLLRAGAAAVDGIGGKRNRGGGRCWLLLPGMPCPDPAETIPVPATPRPADPRLAELLADTALLDEPGMPPAPGPSRVADMVDQPPSPDRVIHQVVLETQSPLVVQHQVLGNVVLTRDDVPGSMLLPVILSRLDGRVDHREVVVNDARPAIRDATGVIRAGRPTPAVWQRSKDRRDGELVNAARRPPDPAARSKAIRGGHVAWVGDGQWQVVDPPHAVSTHAVVDDDAGRPTTTGGGVFTYLGIPAGTLLVSEVVLPARVGLRLQPGDQLRLGRSRKDDYGQVVVRAVSVVDPLAGPTVPAGTAVSVWCVSDVLLRDAWGASDPSPRALASALTQRLATAVTVVESTPPAPVTLAHRAARRDSFHTRWGRPRPSLVGLAAGSMITVRVAEDVPAEVVTAVHRDGIGERTAEGFGQIRFDAAEIRADRPMLVDGAPVVTGVEVSPGPLPPAPTLLEVSAWRASIHRAIAEVLTKEADRVITGASCVTSRAQWGSLREQLPLLATAEGQQRVDRWLGNTGGVPARKKAWGGALDDLRSLFTDRTQVWRRLGLDGPRTDLVLADGREDACRGVLWHEAVTLLVCATARQVTRQQQSTPAVTDGDDHVG